MAAPELEILDGDEARADWQALLARCGKSSIQQHWDYGRFAAATGRRVERVRLLLDGQPVGLAQIAGWALPGQVHLRVLHRGPLFLPELGEAERIALARLLTRRDSAWARRFLFWVPELPEGEEARALVRGAGRRRRVMTGLSSGWLDLARPAEALEAALHGKWRNALAGARKAGLRLEATRAGRHTAWLLAQTEALRRKRRFQGVSAEIDGRFLQDFLPAEDVLQVTALKGSRPWAACLFIRHGAGATYYLGHNTEEGRAAGAHNLCLWEGMLALQKAGVRWLDLGGFNTVEVPGIARFKLRTGCAPYTLAGTYL